jgi:hypothetical protein
MVKKMNITPMNLQIVVPKTTDAAQIQHNRDRQEAVQQDMGMLQTKQEANLKQMQVQARDKAEEGKIKEDEEHQKRQGQNNQKQAKASSDSAEDEENIPLAIDTFRGRKIDIKL